MNKYADPKAWILEHQESIMAFYLGEPISSKLIRSPFRDDANPTCGFYYGRTGRLYLHDFGTDEHFDCIEIVKRKYELRYTEAVNLILMQEDKYNSDEVVEVRNHKKVEFVPGNDDFSYFLNLGITPDTLEKYGVTTARAVYVNEDLFWRSTEKNPIYIYVFPSGKFKAYRPLSKDRNKKWKSNCTIKDVQGYLQLPKKGRLCFITSSMKDVMILRELGYSAIAFNSEGIPTRGQNGEYVQEIIDHLKTRFEEIILFLDNDESGVRYTGSISRKYNIKSVLIPENLPKDISDVVEKYGMKKARKLVRKLIRKCLKEEETFDQYVADNSIKETIFDNGEHN